MAAKSPVRQHLVSTVAAIERHNGPDDPRLVSLRSELATEGLAEHIQAVLASAPPLSAAQRHRLALLVHPGLTSKAG